MMKRKFMARLVAVITALLLTTTIGIADEGRYQAHWNGKSYLIMDSDKGHMWTYYGDSILYNGRINGDDFESPNESKIWKQSHGKWIKQ